MQLLYAAILYAVIICSYILYYLLFNFFVYFNMLTVQRNIYCLAFNKNENLSKCRCLHGLYYYYVI